MERVGWGSHQPEGRAGAMRSAEWVDLHRLLESSHSARTPGIAEQKKTTRRSSVILMVQNGSWFVVINQLSLKLLMVIDGKKL